MKKLLKQGKIINASFDGFISGDLMIDGDRIAGIGSFGNSDADEIIDVGGRCVIPGFIDIHTHGSYGVNYAYPGDNDFSEALMWSAREGVTTVLPTVGVRSFDELIKAINNIKKEAKAGHSGASIGGIHLEGPFISTAKKGAMKSLDVPCDVDTFCALADAAEGMLRVMTIAPERENAIEVIKEGVRRGVRMSIGHTTANESTALAAIDAGASGATHTFNAMTGLGHRSPMAVGAVLTDSRVTCEAICDMVHLSPITVKLIRAAKGVDGMILVSDCGLIAGLGDGDFDVDGMVRYVRNGVSKNAEGTIAGSTYSMGYDAVKLRGLGFGISEIARLGAYNPAKAVGLLDEIGSLEAGKRADMIVCDEGCNIINVFARGERIR